MKNNLPLCYNINGFLFYSGVIQMLIGECLNDNRIWNGRDSVILYWRLDIQKLSLFFACNVWKLIIFAVILQGESERKKESQPEKIGRFSG